jgi:hypothetical protein
MKIDYLRIIHNGHLRERCPNWFLKFYPCGDVLGEISDERTDYKGFQYIKYQLDEQTTQYLFSIPEHIQSLKITEGRKTTNADLFVIGTLNSGSRVFSFEKEQIKSAMTKENKYLQTIISISEIVRKHGIKKY